VGAGFLRVLRFPLPIFIPPISPQSPSPIIRGWHNRLVSDRSTQSPTPLIKKKIVPNTLWIVGCTLPLPELELRPVSCPARGKSLYQLSYPRSGSFFTRKTLRNPVRQLICDYSENITKNMRTDCSQNVEFSSLLGRVVHIFKGKDIPVTGRGGP
jgi:hypothetical protein